MLALDTDYFRYGSLRTGSTLPALFEGMRARIPAKTQAKPRANTLHYYAVSGAGDSQAGFRSI
jgi:hypothetical protein